LVTPRTVRDATSLLGPALLQCKEQKAALVEKVGNTSVHRWPAPTHMLRHGHPCFLAYVLPQMAPWLREMGWQCLLLTLLIAVFFFLHYR